MEISSNVARVSGFGEPNMYISSIYNTQPVDRIESIEPRNYRPKYPSSDTESKAESIQSSPEAKASYKPGDLVHLYA
ncbi:MAG: hypothetical protein MUF77_05445 [Leptospira sp.]|jgi:hypothetical protein|nr:hypothetical protein [Leptospira sp.]